jgi:large subunit ribosomal protein L6
MSKLAKKPIAHPKEVTLDIRDRSLLVSGPKGELVVAIPKGVKAEKCEEGLKINGEESRLLGLFASLSENAIEGVTSGFRKELELVGVGYKAELKGDALKLSLGFSHPIEYQVPSGVKVRVDGATRITVEGIDKQQVGQVAAEIRRFRPPEPYKGKGIRYKDEVVRRKHGKVMKALAGGA